MKNDKFSLTLVRGKRGWIGISLKDRDERRMGRGKDKQEQMQDIW